MTSPDIDQARYNVERGLRAASLLANPDFLWIIDDLTSFHLSALVAAKPGPAEADAVQYHHTMQHALTEIVGTLQQYAQVGEAQADVIQFEAEYGEEDI